MRQAARTDDNQKSIVKALRQMGCSVTPTHRMGKGFPDLAVGIAGVNLFFELKDGDKPPSARKLTLDELEWHSSWRGQVCIVESLSEAVGVVQGILRGRT